jgi:hypothetical protein
MAETEFSTKSFQLAIFIHASESLPYLRTEPDRDAAGKVNFIFRDDAGRGPARIQPRRGRPRPQPLRLTNLPSATNEWNRRKFKNWRLPQ